MTEASVVDGQDSEPSVERAPRQQWFRRPVVAGAVLLAIYVVLSFANDDRAFLGTDTGGKVATLQVIEERGGLDPDIGYWAVEHDPEADLHPLWYTSTFDEKFVQASTLPVLYAAVPLYDLGGYRLALLLPMVGAVAAAFAARSLAKELADTDGWLAFWVVGLASPMVIYALDFWEHTIGVALMGWGVVVAVRIFAGRRGWPWAFVAGLLFGAAATLRTEAFVYALVTFGALCIAMLFDRESGVVPAFAAGAAGVVGLVLPVAANALLEQATIGSVMRAGRASGVASSLGTQGDKVGEAILTSVGLFPALDRQSYFIGLGLLALLAFAVVTSASLERRGGRGGPPPAVVAMAGVVFLYVLRLADGPGFVPGMIAATPIAAAGLALGWRGSREARFVTIVALVALPLVWRFQFPGGAPPQWAGRYVLVTGFLLLVVGLVSLPLVAPWLRKSLVALSVAVTVFGLVWVSIRTNDVADALAALTTRPEPVVISDIAHLAREGGAFYDDKPWLTAVGDTALVDAVQIVEDEGFDELAFVTLDDGSDPEELPDGWQAAGTERVELVDDVWLNVTTYRRAPSE